MKRKQQTTKLKRIVIVDDSPVVLRSLVELHLERYADVAEVETYSHPYDALPKIDDSIDLLIVDLEMPGMDGKKFVDYARAERPLRRGASSSRPPTPPTSSTSASASARPSPSSTRPRRSSRRRF